VLKPGQVWENQVSARLAKEWGIPLERAQCRIIKIAPRVLVENVATGRLSRVNIERFTLPSYRCILPASLPL
jgi:hypothetical protein